MDLTAAAYPLNDRELVARFLAGERECFGLLVRRHGKPLWATLRRSAADIEEARDVFQETWLRAFEGLGSLRDTSRLRSWLLSIALNLVRQGHRRKERFAAGALVPDLPADVDVSLEVDLREEVALLRQRITQLPPRQRQVLDLRSNHGLSHAEIACMLGISEESSRANYYQALRKLRAELDGASE